MAIPLQSKTNWSTGIKETHKDQRRLEPTTKTTAQTDTNINTHAFRRWIITSHDITMVRCAIVGDGFISRIEPLWNSTRVPVLPIIDPYDDSTDDRDTVHFFSRDRLSAEAMLHDDILRTSLSFYCPTMIFIHLGREDIYNDTSAKKIFQTLQTLRSELDSYCQVFICEIPRSGKPGVEPESFARQRRVINHMLHQQGKYTGGWKFLHFGGFKCPSMFDPADRLHFREPDLRRYCDAFQRKVERACENVMQMRAVQNGLEERWRGVL